MRPYPIDPVYLEAVARTRAPDALDLDDRPALRFPRGKEALLSTRRELAILTGLLVFTFAVRAFRADQPIVENYVGRQVPTAMVARNLERGSGFGRPRLDTAPFPNLFMVEPPIYAAAVVLMRQATGWGLEPAGRLTSALALVGGAWGLFGLVRRREGSAVAFMAVAAFALFPVTIRYGRAFQPDALMLGAALAGLRCWDEHEAGGGWAWLAVGWALLATAFAVKVVVALVLVPLIGMILRPRTVPKVALAVVALGPAVVWYLHAAGVLAAGGGSRASVDNASIWLRVLWPSALFQAETIGHIGRFLVVRAFTPVGFALAVWGLARGGDRLWRVWGGAVLAMLAILAGKLHHEYYWLALAPVVAVGVALALKRLAERGAVVAGLAVVAVLGLTAVQSASTWRTPAEWAQLPEAVRAVRAHVPPDVWLVAPEALLFEADRRGCRLELSRNAAIRAAGEWGTVDLPEGPLALVEFYRTKGARFVAVVGDDPARSALREAIRRRYNVQVDQPGVLLAALTDPDREEGPHGRE